MSHRVYAASSRHLFRSGSLNEKSGKLAGRVVEGREDCFQIVIFKVSANGLPENIAEVCGYVQVSSFVKLVFFETGPGSVNTPTANSSSKRKHKASMSMIGAAVAILTRSASEFGHREDQGIFGELSEIRPESRD